MKSLLAPKHKTTIVLLYNKYALCISCRYIPLQPLTLQLDYALFLDALTSFLKQKYSILLHDA